jgi:hypothetical protein
MTTSLGTVCGNALRIPSVEFVEAKDNWKEQWMSARHCRSIGALMASRMFVLILSNHSRANQHDCRLDADAVKSTFRLLAQMFLPCWPPSIQVF